MESMKRSPLVDGLGIVRLLLESKTPMGVTQISECLNTPKSSTHRVLQSLKQLGFVEQRRTTSMYTINPVIFEFVNILASQFGTSPHLESPIREAANKFKCTGYLSMLGGIDTYVILGVGDEGNTSRLGTHGPAYATSVGKILVAQLDEKEWPRFAPTKEDTPISKYTNMDPDKFYLQLKEARKRGLAWNHRESSIDHVSVAAVVREPFVNPPRMAVAFLFSHKELLYYDHAEIEKEILILAGKLESVLGVSDRPVHH